MKLLLFGATLAVASTPAHAGGEADGGNDWLALDSQLGGLGASAQQQGSGVNVGALIRASYRDSDFQNALGDEFGGFLLDDARLFASGNYGEFAWRLSMDFAEGANGYPVDLGPPVDDDAAPTETVSQEFRAELLDAYARWELSDAFGVQIGQFNARDAFSGDVGSNRLLFHNRSFIGERFHEYDLGVQVDGVWGNQEYPEFVWSFAALNGDDGAESDLDLRARVDFNHLGNGAGWSEGAYGSQNDSNGTLGLFWAEDSDVGASTEKGTVWGADYRATFGPFGVQAEWIDFDDAAAAAADAGLGMSGASAWSAGLSYLFGAEQNWELGGRWEDLDSESNETRLTAGLTYYVAGHDIKWQLNWVDISSDASAEEGTVLQLGLSVGLAAQFN